MHTDGFGIVFFTVILPVSALLIIIIKYLVEYSSEVRYVKREIKRAKTRNEYIHWRHALLYIRLSIIPGITPKKARRIIKKLSG